MRLHAAGCLLLSALSSGAQQDKAVALVERAKQAIYAEESRQQAGICREDATTLDMNICLFDEIKKSEANYLALVRAIGALIRMQGDNPRVRRPKHIPFDDVEAAWVKYRDRTCNAIREDFGKGSGAGPAHGYCMEELYGSHVHDLGELYGEVLK